MMQALRVAATGMAAQQTNVDVLSNNIANLNTTGYKENVAAFNDLVYLNQGGVGATTSDAGTITPTGKQIGLGVNVSSVYRIMEQGTINRTGNVFDVAIQGEGFFQVTMPDGDTSYTRDGSFQIDNTGQLVTKEGFPVDPNITIPEDAVDLSISSTGNVSASVNGNFQDLGTLTLARFQNPAGLKNEGSNFYSETEASGTAQTIDPGDDGAGTLLQFALEASNVDSVESITQLIAAQRAYELNSRVISTVDDMLSALSNIR